MKLHIASLAAVAAVALVAVTGCSVGSGADEGTTSADDAALTNMGVLVREPSSTVRDYQTNATKIRLYGVQSGDDAFATIADRTTWKTTSVHVGDSIGRGYRVSAIRPGSIDLESVKGTVHLAVGHDFDAKMIQHRFDTAAVDHGKHAWTVDAASMADVRAHYGTGATAEDRSATPPSDTGLPPQAAVAFTSVNANGVFGRLGFHEGDILMSLDGAQLQAADLDKVAERLTHPGTVTLVVSDQGARHPVTFTVR